MSSLNKMHNEAQNPRIGPCGPQEAGGTGHSLRTAWRGREGRQGRGGKEDLQSLPDFTLPPPTAPPARTTRTTRIMRCGQKKEVTKAKDQKAGFLRTEKTAA